MILALLTFFNAYSHPQQTYSANIDVYQSRGIFWHPNNQPEIKICEPDNIDLNQSGINASLNFKTSLFNIKLFSSFLSSKKENGSDQLRRPEKTYGVNFSKKIDTNYLGDLDLNLLYNHYGKHFDTHSTNFSTIEMDSTDLVSLKIEKKLKDNSYFLKITNLLSENFQRPHGYNQDKRIIKFGLKY